MKFYQSKSPFYLMSNILNAYFRIDIVEMSLNECKVQINPAIIYVHNQILQKPAKYPNFRTEIRMNAIPKGQVAFTFNNVCQGRKLRRLIIGFVNSKVVAGDFQVSPFNLR